MWWSKASVVGELKDSAGFRSSRAVQPSVNETEQAWSLLDRVEQSSRFGRRMRLPA